MFPYYLEEDKTTKKKKVEFSKAWLAGCVIISVVFTAVSYFLSFLDKNPVSELSIAIIEACWGTSSVSFIGYALQNSVRAFTASRFGIPKKDVAEPLKEDTDTEPDLRQDLVAVLAKHTKTK